MNATNKVYFVIGKQKIKVECIITDTIITINDSYCVNLDKTKEYILNDLLIISPIFSKYRTVEDMFYEWKTHNILYNWGVAKSHTMSVDFELKQNKFLKWCYKIFAKVFKE